MKITFVSSLPEYGPPIATALRVIGYYFLLVFSLGFLIIAATAVALYCTGSLTF